MSVTSRTLNNRTKSSESPVIATIRAVMYGVTILLVVCTGYLIISLAFGRVQHLVDDLRYGRPRTMQISAYVGHNEAPGRPTHLVAMNLDRQVMFIELPGGDPSKTRSYQGPYLVGADADLTPVQLSVYDIDGDGLNDVLLEVRQEVLVFLNRDGAFRPPTDQETEQLRMINHD